jgi:phosphomannomutase
MNRIEDVPKGPRAGRATKFDPWPAYITHIHSFFPKSSLTRPIRLLAEAGNGLGGEIVSRLLQDTPIEITPLLFVPDGTYPNHIPNPMLPEARKLAQSEAKRAKYNLTVIFDGDADRGAFLDESGEFVPADYFDTLIMDKIIHPRFPNSPVVIDYRRGMVTEWAAEKQGYTIVRSKAGYPNLKQAMRDHKAEFGFEASAHTLWQHTFYAESSGLTLLAILSLLSEGTKSFSELLKPYREAIVMRDEENFTVTDPEAVMKKIASTYQDGDISYPDGMVIHYPEWRASLRKSNTEPLVRLCIEASDTSTLDKKHQELTQLVRQFEVQPTPDS